MTVRPPWPERVRVYRGRTVHATRTTRRHHGAPADWDTDTDTACGRDVRLDDGDRALPDTATVTCRACQTVLTKET